MRNKDGRTFEHRRLETHGIKCDVGNDTADRVSNRTSAEANSFGVSTHHSCTVVLSTLLVDVVFKTMAGLLNVQSLQWSQTFGC